MKYNWSIIGHEDKLNRLEADIASGNIAHAYLLAGPNSVGKFTVARKMAQILQCENDFCYVCPTCKQIESGTHFDTMEYKDDGNMIVVDDVKNIIKRLITTPQGKYKVLLIQSIERMNNESANSFLKMLEEPPKQTIMIFTTDEINTLLPTIISRVRVVTFNVVSVDYLEGKLREIYPQAEEDIIKKVCLFSLGKTGKAVHLMENPDALANYLRIYNDIQNFLTHKNIAQRFAYANELAEEEKQLMIFLDVLKHIVRSRMIEGREESLKQGENLAILSKISNFGGYARRNINMRMYLEDLMLELG